MNAPITGHAPECPPTVSRHDASLSERMVLALDCQTTGATPDKGRLLEVGWAWGRADSNPLCAGVQSRLIRTGRDASIPPAVLKLTGIMEKEMEHSVPKDAAWRDLMAAAAKVSAQNRSRTCLLVIHFARFELPFLRQLHSSAEKDNTFPFQVICTHAIAQRLLPELPRRGLRALAGYFGHAVPELKRSADHVLATLSIWKGLLKLLQSRCQVTTLSALHDWMAGPVIRSRIKRTFPLPDTVRCVVPDKPGIYRMRRANGEILYIGKAKSLKQRVNSYFRAKAPHAEHILEMLTQAWDLDFVPTGSALEAAVLESDEIKRHRPPYNIALCSSKAITTCKA